MEIDIQKMVEDYNSILKENYNGNYERFGKNVEDFKKRYGAIEDDFMFEGSKVKTKFLSISQGNKTIVLPNFLDTYFSSFPEFSENNMMIETMFESGHKTGDDFKDIELNSPAILENNVNGERVSSEKGKLKLHDSGFCKGAVPVVLKKMDLF